MRTDFENNVIAELRALREEIYVLRLRLTPSSTRPKAVEINQIVSSEALLSWWDDYCCLPFTTRDAAAGLLGDTNPTNSTLTRIGHLCTSLGFVRKQVREGGRRVWRYVK